jgi:predicted small secreted protein
MKNTILIVLAVLALGAVFSGCERNDYQHPMHRNN